MPRVGSVEGFTEEHPAESVLLRPVGLGVSMPGVVGKVLGHGLVGVQPDLAETQTARLFLGQFKQADADPAALGCEQDGQLQPAMADDRIRPGTRAGCGVPGCVRYL
jgi:hypothetical protein